MTPHVLRAPDAVEPTSPTPKFEQLLARLEQIVSDMETADLPLDKLLSTYEEGMRLVKACGERLSDADQKIEILSKPVAAAESRPAMVADTLPEPAKGGEDIRLF